MPNGIGHSQRGSPGILVIMIKGDICDFMCVHVCVWQGLSADVTQIGVQCRI